jgi:hypothetical protein
MNGAGKLLTSVIIDWNDRPYNPNANEWTSKAWSLCGNGIAACALIVRQWETNQRKPLYVEYIFSTTRLCGL